VDEVTFAATTVAAAFLTQATQEGYQRVREAIGRLIRRSRQEDEAAQLERLDRDRTAVAQAPAGDREAVVRAAAAEWAPVLVRLAESEPVAYAELLALARQDRPTSVVSQHNHGSGTFLFGMSGYCIVAAFMSRLSTGDRVGGVLVAVGLPLGGVVVLAFVFTTLTEVCAAGTANAADSARRRGAQGSEPQPFESSVRGRSRPCREPSAQSWLDSSRGSSVSWPSAKRLQTGPTTLANSPSPRSPRHAPR